LYAQGDQKIRKSCPIYKKKYPYQSSTNKMQNFDIKAMFESPKYLQQTTFKTLKYLQQIMFLNCLFWAKI